ncbi:hypothetical protein, conserved [Trypanosoma brucei gambiense DAL972]|uniref:RING-type domain-containing protein n=1 Tax=Trypanosoma brucei gambiense (strain MHOM/CI/86/DAL972) TaxID=679716 RepID=C9ZRZ5_TRYB9|nr:hypothetical protein, conserved [Trypanosoma brucei gambiense DAL972]CBH12131.1 hypothetical protein, conserved [Trypanosoma brucei gambiense DAL972]|eukprot:XP_011774414.1 hypothetical protein, conserved [Trypanosoma brucei gambiense DAL972]
MPPRKRSKRPRDQEQSAEAETATTGIESLVGREGDPITHDFIDECNGDESDSDNQILAASFKKRTKRRAEKMVGNGNDTVLTDGDDDECIAEQEDKVTKALQARLRCGMQRFATSATNQGGLVKPSGPPSSVAAAAQRSTTTKRDNLTNSRRQEIFVEHVKHFMRYTVIADKARKLVSLEERPKEDPDVGNDRVELLRIHVSLPCVWRYILHEWERVEEASKKSSSLAASRDASVSRLVSLFMKCLNSLDGIHALLFIACAACRALDLTGGVTSVLLHLLLETGRVEEDRLLKSDSGELVYKAIEEIDKEMHSRFGGSDCCYFQAHSYLLLLIWYTQRDVSDNGGPLKMSHQVVLSQAFVKATSPYQTARTRRGSKAAASVAPSEESGKRKPRGRRGAGSSEDGAALSGFDRHATLVTEVQEHETRWAEDSSKFLFSLYALQNASGSASYGMKKLALREVMGAVFLFHRVLSESGVNDFLLESKESRIRELHEWSLSKGFVTPPLTHGGESSNNGTTVNSFASTDVGEDGLNVMSMAGRTYRECTDVERSFPRVANARAMLQHVTQIAAANYRGNTRAVGEGFPHEYIRARLHPHQVESLAYMLERETRGLAQYVELRGFFEATSGLPSEVADRSAGRGSREFSLFYSSMSSEWFIVRSDSLSARFARRALHCGFLCDEMGLGKTLVVLSLCATAKKRAIELEETEVPTVTTLGTVKGSNVGAVNKAFAESDAGTAGAGEDEPIYLWRHIRVRKTGALWSDMLEVLYGSLPQPVYLPTPKPLPKTTLVVVPLSLLIQWVSEIDRFYPLARYILFHGPSRQRYTYEDFCSADFVITTYETVGAHLRVETDAAFRLLTMTLPYMEHKDASLAQWDTFCRGCNERRARAASASQGVNDCDGSADVFDSILSLFESARRQVVLEAEGAPPGPTLDFVSQWDKTFREFLRSDVLYLTDFVFERIILDESQKCSKTSRLQYLQARRRWVVSGTPINNNDVNSLQPLFKFLWAELSPSYSVSPLSAFYCSSYDKQRHMISALNAFRSSRKMARYAINSFYVGRHSKSSPSDTRHVLTQPAIRKPLCMCRLCNPFTKKTVYPKSPVLTLKDALYRRVTSAASEEETEGFISDRGGLFRSWRFSVPLTHLMVRHEKTEELQRALQLSPVTEAHVEVPLLDGERFLYDYAGDVVARGVALLQRQGLVGNCSAKLLSWVCLLGRMALHPSTAFADVRNSDQALYVQSHQKNEQVASNFLSSVVSVTPNDALAYARKLIANRLNTTGTRKGRGETNVLVPPETTVETLRKLTLDPPEVPECAICLDTMLHPTLLSCFHLFCKECLFATIQVARPTLSNETTARCPHCRNPKSMRGKMMVIQVENTQVSTLGALQDEGMAPPNGENVSHEELKRRVDAVGRGSRIPRLIQLLEDIWNEAPDDNVLVFSKVPAILQMGEVALKEAGYQNVHVIDNHVTLVQRKKIFAQLHANAATTASATGSASGSTPSGNNRGHVLFLSSRVACSGLNLVFANRLIFMEPNLNPAQHQQAVGRIDRCGQLKRTYVYVMYAPRTIEERIMNRTSALLQEASQGTFPDVATGRGAPAGNTSSMGQSELITLLQAQQT